MSFRLAKAPHSEFRHVAQWGSVVRPPVRRRDRIRRNRHDVACRPIHERIFVGEHLGIGSVGYDAKIPGGYNRERGLLERTFRHFGEEVLDDPRVLFLAMASSSVTCFESDGFNALIAAPMRFPISSFRRWGISSDEISINPAEDSSDQVPGAEMVGNVESAASPPTEARPASKISRRPRLNAVGESSRY